MTRIPGWQDLLAWSGSTGYGRGARTLRFSTILQHYKEEFGSLPLIVKLAGTSGKGSTGAMLEAVLAADGKKTGFFTSPHLVHPAERIRVEGIDATNERLDLAAAEVAGLLEHIVSMKGIGFRSSYFETLVVLALRTFAHAGVDVAIMEAGIGGYNDVVSMLEGPLSAITTVGYDHVDILGNSLEEIAADKAGIATSFSELVLGPGISPPAQNAILLDAEKRGVHIRIASREKIRSEPLGLAGHRIHLAPDMGGSCFVLPLAGDYQVDNLAVAAEMVQALWERGTVARKESLAGAAMTRWPARLEYLPGMPAWLLDAAHNPLAFSELLKFVKQFPRKDQTLVFGATEKTKALEGLRLLGPVFQQIFWVDGFYRAAQIEPADSPELPPYIHVPTPEEVLHRSLRQYHGCEHTIVVTGSIFLVGVIRQLLVERRTA